jgi:hypothetical protein
MFKISVDTNYIFSSIEDKRCLHRRVLSPGIQRRVSVESQRMFRRNISSPSSGSKNKLQKKAGD